MHKHLLFFGLGLLAASVSAQEPRHLAFERDSVIWVANPDGSHQRKIAGGQSPDLSPDGRRVVFNTVQAIGKPANRHIAIADLATGKIVILHTVPGTNAMQPVWSPDGQRLVFNYYVGDAQQIGVINANDTDFHPLQASPKAHSYWASAWGPGGKTIYAQDMEYLDQLLLDGKVLKHWNIQKLIPGGSMDGDARLALSPDGQRLLMDVGMDEETKRKGWDGPLPAIWLMDLASQRLTRVTPRSIFGSDCHWLDADTICCRILAAGEEESSIYRLSLDGKTRQRLVKNGRLPSVAPVESSVEAKARK